MTGRTHGKPSLDLCRVVIGIVASHYRTPVQDMISDRRKAVVPRHVAMWVTREITGYSYPRIGRAFGGRDTSTVISAVKRVDERRANNEEYASVTLALREKAKAEIDRLCSEQERMPAISEAAAIVESGLKEVGQTFSIRAHHLARTNPDAFVTLITEMNERMGEIL